MSLEQRIESIIETPIAHLGYEVVRIKMLDGERCNTLQIMIDREDEAAITVEDCEAASRQISALLDVEDPIAENYNLEVSSPGVERPLTRAKDFVRFSGLEAKIEVQDKIDGRRRFKGRLQGIENEQVTIDVPVDGKDESVSVEIALDNIANAKLVLNDELLAMHESN